MRIGIIGAGHVGEALARRLGEVGHGVRVANSRGPDTLRDFAHRTGAEPVRVEEAASDADVLILAVPLHRVRDLPKTAFETLPRSAVVVDTANYQPRLNGAVAEIGDALTESAWVSGQLGVPVIKAFNSMTAHSMAHRGRPKGARDRVAVPVAGDDPKARATVMGLVEELGFTAFDAGPLAESWRQQPGQPAYATDPSPAELPLLLRRADRQAAPRNRDKAMELMARLPPGFPVPQLVRVARLFAGLDRLDPRSWLALARLGGAMLRSRRSVAGS